MRSALFAAVLVVGCAHLPRPFAPATTTVTGTVLSPIDGTPVVGASVFLDGTAYSTRTDSVGRFELARVPRGEYDLAVQDPRIADLWIPALWLQKDRMRLVLAPHAEPVDSLKARGRAYPLIIIRADPDSVFAGVWAPKAGYHFAPTIDVMNVKNIQVLKGARGLAYGKSTVAGVILVTLQPVAATKPARK